MHMTRWIGASWLFLLLLAGCSPSNNGPAAENGPESTPLPPPLVSESTAAPVATLSPSGKATPDPGLATTGLSSPVSGPAAARPPASGASVSTDRLHYKPGETIVITVHRAADATIYPVPGEMGCPVITVQSLQDSSWEAMAICPWSGPDSALPGVQMRDLAWGFYLDTSGPAGQEAGSGQPAVPDTFEGDLSELPTLTPPPPGYSGPEVPRGPGRTDPGSSLVNALDPGTYRIVFAFVSGPGTVVTAVYSDPFVVGD